MRPNERERLLGQIMTVIAAGTASWATPACGGSVTEDTGTGRNTDGGRGGGGVVGGQGSVEGGGVANGSRPGAAGAGGVGAATARGGAGAGAGGVGGRSAFRAVPPDASCGADLPSREFAVDPLPPQCAVADGVYYYFAGACVPAPADGRSCDDVLTLECVAGLYNCGLQGRADAVCGPLPLDEHAGECCYILAGDCPVGRPFLVDGNARSAPTARRDDWAEAVSPDVSMLGGRTRAALAEAWCRDGATEHASVASFARFTLQLLALGAPPDLVKAAARAASDELEHARSAFGLASAYAGCALGPGALPVHGALDHPISLREFACAVAREACVAETVSALLVAAARDAATDAAVRRVLTLVAEQEVDHVLLGWRALGWALSHGDRALRDAVGLVFARARDHVGFGAISEHPGPDAVMRSHGYLSVAERRGIAEAALADVVGPAARALLNVGTPGGVGLEEALRPMGAS